MKGTLEAEEIVRYEEDGPRVVLLDQRRLPDDVVELECTSAAEVAAAIRNLAIRGAPAIGIAAAYGLALAAQRGEDVGVATCVRTSTSYLLIGFSRAQLGRLPTLVEMRVFARS